MHKRYAVLVRACFMAGRAGNLRVGRFPFVPVLLPRTSPPPYREAAMMAGFSLTVTKGTLL